VNTETKVNSQYEDLAGYIRGSHVWKHIRFSVMQQALWMISAMLLVTEMMRAADATIGPMLVLALALAAGGAGAIAHMIRKPLPAHERMLGGFFGVVACILFSMGQKITDQLVSPILLGLSVSLTSAACMNDHLLRALGYFGLHDDDADAMRREIIHSAMLPMFSLLIFSLILMRLNFRFAANLSALTCAVIQCFVALNNPIDRRVLHKLDRWDLVQAGEADGRTQLKAWLDSKLYDKHRMPWGIRTIENTLRPFNRHTVIGFDQVKQDDNNPVVYVCNHGNFYGPIVADLFTPINVRFWVLSTMMENLKGTTDYIYTNTFSHVKWLPPPIRRIVAYITARVSHWGMRSIEGIPVYRTEPSKLLLTFRATMDAMQSGDSILIFPENPHMETDQKGYVTEGIGDFFDGFAMVAPLYYKRTHKCCRFVPMFAHQPSRTVIFGDEILFDPTHGANAERDRLSRDLRDAMQALSDRADAEWAAKKSGKKSA